MAKNEFPAYKKALVSDLIPYARNSRTHSDEQVSQIAASIKEFGFTNPILVDGENGVIAGHGRLLAAKKLGMDTVPVIELKNLTEAQRRAYIIADNKLALNAGWNDEMLRVEFADLSDAGFDLTLIGFSTEELETLIIYASEADMPTLPDGDREPLQQMAFMLHDDQADTVREAIDVAKRMGEFWETGNTNINGNALARVCEMFMVQHGNS